MSSVGFSTTNSLNTTVSSLDTALYTAISSLSVSNLNQSTLLAMQTQIQQWSTVLTLISSLNKEIGDTFKGLVNKF